MSSNDVLPAQPTAAVGFDAAPLTPHPQPSPLPAWTPAPAALATLAEAASTLSPPIGLTGAHAPPTSSTHTSPIPPAMPPPQINGHVAPPANVSAAIIFPGLNNLPPLQELMPLSDELPSASPPPPQVPVPTNSTHNDNQVESSEDEGDDDGSEGEQQQQSLHRRHRWGPLVECTDVPSQDELDHIMSKGEHSAKDVKYWEKKTFFDVDDPEIELGESGRIEFSVTYNGTKEKPNKERVMQSDVVHIGGYEWRIKFYPRGDNSSYLSCYVECVSMEATQSQEFEEFRTLPFPQLVSEKNKLKKRRSVAAQIGLVMYNPSEPRVHEFQADAHQYKHRSADYGWQKFSYAYHDSFHQRRFGQRTAILKNDTLAFTAFIRVVRDPTGCLWVHDAKASPTTLYDSSIETTGLRPFVFRGPELPAMGVLLHVPLFRSLIYQTTSKCRTVALLQTFLMKMLSRKCSPAYGTVRYGEVGDAVTSLQWTVQKLTEGCNDHETSLLKIVTGTLHPEEGHAVGSNRLKTKSVRSVKQALLAQPTQLPTSTLLTLELQRQEFDTRTRRWKKLVNKVEMDETLRVGGFRYNLYGYVTHTGGLTSNEHTLYVRPGGAGTLWYGYREGKVVALTQKQAVGTHCGVEPRKDSSKNGMTHSALRAVAEHAMEEVAYVVFYIRDDNGLASLDREVWQGIREKLARSLQRVADPSNVAATEGSTWDVRAIKGRTAPPTGSGAVTPQWRMDGDDIVMSDAENNDDVPSPVDPLAVSVQLANVATNNSSTRPDIISTIDALGQDYYRGGELDNMRHGYGHLITMSGDEYTGDFQHNRPHGYGTMTYSASGSTYTGTWHAGEHHGHGTLTETSGNRYVGGWEHGRKHGPFTVTGIYSDEDRSCCNICYNKDITTAFYDCGHVLACHDCARKMDNCPVCRKRILARVQLFGVRVVME